MSNLCVCGCTDRSEKRLSRIATDSDLQRFVDGTRQDSVDVILDSGVVDTSVIDWKREARVHVGFKFNKIFLGTDGAASSRLGQMLPLRVEGSIPYSAPLNCVCGCTDKSEKRLSRMSNLCVCGCTDRSEKRLSRMSNLCVCGCTDRSEKRLSKMSNLCVCGCTDRSEKKLSKMSNLCVCGCTDRSEKRLSKMSNLCVFVVVQTGVRRDCPRCLTCVCLWLYRQE